MEEWKKAPGGEPAKSSPDSEIDETLRKFRLQTGLDAGSPLLPFIRLALKASAPGPRPDRQRNGTGQPRPSASPASNASPDDLPDPVPNKPVEPVSSAWVLHLLAASLIGLLFSWLAKAGHLN